MRSKSITAHRISLSLEEIGMTQTQLAEELGLKQPSVAAWCSGKSLPSNKHWKQLGEVLGKAPSWLRGDAEEPYPHESLTYGAIENLYPKDEVAGFDLRYLLTAVSEDLGVIRRDSDLQRLYIVEVQNQLDRIESKLDSLLHDTEKGPSQAPGVKLGRERLSSDARGSGRQTERKRAQGGAKD